MTRGAFHFKYFWLIVVRLPEWETVCAGLPSVRREDLLVLHVPAYRHFVGRLDFNQNEACAVCESLRREPST